MARFITAHVTLCMTRQDVEKLARRFCQAADGPVKNRRVAYDPIAGRMICEWEAPGQDELLAFLATHNVRIRSEREWVMHVRVEASEGEILHL